MLVSKTLCFAEQRQLALAFGTSVAIRAYCFKQHCAWLDCAGVAGNRKRIHDKDEQAAVFLKVRDRLEQGSACRMR